MSTNRATMVTNRATAGAAYAAAAQAYVDAWVELAAQDAAVSGPRVQGVLPIAFGEQPTVLKHQEFLPQSTAQAMCSPNTVGPAVATRAAALVASWSGS